MRLKSVIKFITPPAFVRLVNYFYNSKEKEFLWLSGDYQSWNEAVAASTGYDSEIILEKTRSALLKVKNGEAVYERDSVLFDEIQYTWPVLSGLMWVAACNEGNLNVLDFGGSIGSTYFQNRYFLSSLKRVRWNIIEQPSQVKVGKENFEDDSLRFYESISDCLADTEPNVVLLSGVLQYLEDPYMILDQALKLSCKHIIIDRTPFWAGPEDRLCVQTVPPSIYPASYPSWIFSMRKFEDSLRDRAQIIAQFDCLDNLSSQVKTTWHGFILERKNIRP